MRVIEGDDEPLVELPRGRPKLFRKTPAASTLTLGEFLSSTPKGIDILMSASDAAVATLAHDLVVANGLLPRTRVAIADLDAAAEFHEAVPGAHVVYLGGDRATRGAERLAAQLREADIATIAAPHRVWTAGHVSMFHKFGRQCIALGAAQPYEAKQALQAGVDGLSGPFADRLYDAAVEVGD